MRPRLVLVLLAGLAVVLLAGGTAWALLRPSAESGVSVPPPTRWWPCCCKRAASARALARISDTRSAFCSPVEQSAAGMPFFVMGVTFGIIGFTDTDDDEDDARVSPS